MTDPITPWSVAAASARGTSHRKHDKPCQDSFAFEQIDDEWIVMAVADGAGSAEYSDLGSNVAVQAAIAHFVEKFRMFSRGGRITEERLQTALMMTVQATISAVQETARNILRPARELASTLILVVGGPTVTATLHVGDGGVVIENREGRLVTLSKPDAGEYMGESTFLVSSNALSKARIEFGPPARSIALFSDGIQMLTLQYPSWDPFEPFFRQTFEFMRASRSNATRDLETFLASDRLATRTDDDITLVIARRDLPLRVASEPVDAVPATATPEPAPIAAAAAVEAAASVSVVSLEVVA